jgi:hypothetical protein
MVEHHEAILLLVREEKTGSAFALARALVEGMYRGLWINLPATDVELARFERQDEIGLTMTQLARAVDDAYHAEGFFTELKARSWEALNSYAHTGMLQLGRRFTAHSIEPAYSDREITEVTTSMTTCLILLVERFLAARNHSDECSAVERLTETYGELLHRQPS